MQSPQEKVDAAIWVLGAIQSLEDMGIIEVVGGKPTLTMYGVSNFDQLDAGWRPDDEQIMHVLSLTNIKANGDVFKLVRTFRDNRDELREFIGE